MKVDDKYIYAHCHKPLSLRIFNLVTQRNEEREMPCGKCYHCRITHVNEWVTRMRLQSMTYAHTYFITLDIAPNPIEKISQLTHARWHNINKNHKYGYQPITLDKSIAQNFIKRLRRYNNLPTLSYFLVGEYGHTYGRPHYHAILWCDEEITQEMLQKAWTLENKFIGNVDFHDLNTNGTLDGRKFSKATYSFTYVCKYLQKSWNFDFSNLPTAEYHSQVRAAIYGLGEYADTKYNKSTRKMCSEYVQRFKPFMLCSKSYAIGGRYFEKNKDRFADGDFRLFGVLDKTNLVFPSYFMRKAKRILCPFVPLSADATFKTTSARIPFVETFLDKLPNVVRSTEPLCEMPCFPLKDSLRLKSMLVEYRDGHTEEISLLNLCVYDRQTHCYCVFNGAFFVMYQYCRKKRTFVVVGDCDYSDFIQRLNTAFENLVGFATKLQAQRALREKDKEESIIRDYSRPEDNDNLCKAFERYEEYSTLLRKQLMENVALRQRMYNHTKNNY